MLIINKESPDHFCWPDIRLTDCDDGYEFQASPLCKEWMHHLALHVARELGASPRIRMFAYRHGSSTLLAVDVYAAQTDRICINITIFLTGKYIRLSAPADNQFDIALPGIVDALHLTASLRSIIQYESEHHPPECLWIT